MGRNLVGYFSKLGDCENTKYSVKIISDSASNKYEEIYLAGESPFVVSYESSTTPFDPIRLSRASINVVANDYLLDVFSHDAHGTKVVLTNESTSVIEWVGFLTNNLLNMPQDSCNYESFTLEAQDCLYTLEKYNYKTIGDKKSIVTFSQILGQIADKCELINTMYIDGSMARSNGSYINMNSLTISEQNLFSSDTDESWNLKEVLEELCRYCGYTALQYKDGLYLFDIQYYSSCTWQGNTSNTSKYGFKYTKKKGWTTYESAGSLGVTNGVTLRKELVMGNGSDISLETIYNKIQVKDSFYEINHLIPDFFEDSLLTNRKGDFWNSDMIYNSGYFNYINGKGKSKKEEKDENSHVYYIRRFDHENYENIYRDSSTLAVVEPNDFIKITNAYTSIDYIGTNSATYNVSAVITNKDDKSHVILVESRLRFEWYDGQHHMEDYGEGKDSKNFTLASGESKTIQLSCTASFNEDYMHSIATDTWYKLDGGTKAYGITYEAGEYTTECIGATIVDLATFDKPIPSQKYNYETDSNISFNRYIMIRQADKPDRMHPYAEWLFNNNITKLKDSQIESVFPKIMGLKSGYSNPMIVDDKAYIAIDTNAIYERYDVQYINPDWTSENSKAKGSLGWFSKQQEITTVSPALIFKLRIGNKYWSSNGWTTTDSCFVVNLGVDATNNGDTDFTGWWNKDHSALNNVSWTEWAGVRGYKIPLTEDIDFSKDIEFDIMMPSKIQKLSDNTGHSGMNNYCWINALDLRVATLMSENYDNADVIYENIINEGSVNTLADIQCKFTSYPGNGMHSYSNVALDGRLITKDTNGNIKNGIKKHGLDNIVNLPEENIIKAYANQYGSPTIKQTMTLVDTISPFTLIKDPTLGKYFAILGGEIDYALGRQKLNLIEIKKWNN